jgi:hypothetical protein
MQTKRSKEAYVLIDHRNSPGVSQEFIKANNLDAPAVGSGQVFESAMIVCHSCGNDVILNPDRSRPREWCWEHDAYMCDHCALVKKLSGSCIPLVRKLEVIYKRLTQSLHF